MLSEQKPYILAWVILRNIEDNYSKDKSLTSEQSYCKSHIYAEHLPLNDNAATTYYFPYLLLGPGKWLVDSLRPKIVK